MFRLQNLLHDKWGTASRPNQQKAPRVRQKGVIVPNSGMVKYVNKWLLKIKFPPGK